MTWHNKVVWTEGMFLQPQHFQQHDRYLEHQLRQRLSAGLGYGWGFVSLSLDEAALALGKLSLNSAQGVLPDGTAFAIPGNDAAPAALDIPADARNEKVVLALVLARPGIVETDAEQAAGSMGPRYAVAEIAVRDSNTTVDRDASLHIGRLNLRLMLERDAGDGFASVGIARVVERRADNKVVLDANYVPPMLHAQGHPILAEADVVTRAPWAAFGEPGPMGSDAFRYPIEDFYRTDPISRASHTMAQCSEFFMAGRHQAPLRTGTHG